MKTAISVKSELAVSRASNRAPEDGSRKQQHSTHPQNHSCPSMIVNGVRTGREATATFADTRNPLLIADVCLNRTGDAASPDDGVLSH